VTVVNNGPAAAAAVVVVDVLPVQETLVSVSDTACSGTTVLTCNLGTLAAGGSRTITVVTLAQTAGTAQNIVTVSTTTPETTTTNNRAEVDTPIAGPFQPPSVPAPVCARLSLDHTPLVAGRRAVVTVHVRGADGPVAVAIRGAGIAKSAKTNANGRARFVVTPTGAGILRVHAVQAASCPATLRELAIPGAFRPPVLTG
jgi:hypothetical protein